MVLPTQSVFKHEKKSCRTKHRLSRGPYARGASRQLHSMSMRYDGTGNQ